MVTRPVEVKDAARSSEFAMSQFKRVLVSNRGEIAIRIAKAASTLGIETVGIYAPADALSLHTRMVSEAREIRSDAADPVRAYRCQVETLLTLAHTALGRQQGRSKGLKLLLRLAQQVQREALGGAGTNPRQALKLFDQASQGLGEGAHGRRQGNRPTLGGSAQCQRSARQESIPARHVLVHSSL